ncbi:MAG: hypothetical protein WC788_03010 [Candidatus Paceibacterota bacterium]|jgi:adenylate cyclase class IV
MDTKNIEIEIRGPLDDESHKQLLKYIDKNGRLLKKQSRFLVDYSTFLEGIGDRKSDIRLRVTNGKIELIVKKGKFGAFAREEASVFVEGGDLKNAFSFMALLGFRKGVAAVRKILRYDVDGVEIAIQDVIRYGTKDEIHSRFYEAEVMTSKTDAEKGKNRIIALLDKIGLKKFGEEDWNEYIAKLNKEANGVYDYDKDNADSLKSMPGL